MTTEKMNPEIKDLWLEGLRSGKYPQGRGMLVNTTRTGGSEFCCLGVLCDIAVQHGIIRANDGDVYGRRRFTTRGAYPEDNGFEYQVLPIEVKEWAGLDSQNPIIESDEGMTATTANDARGYDFRMIADLIEKHL